MDFTQQQKRTTLPYKGDQHYCICFLKVRGHSFLLFPPSLWYIFNWKHKDVSIQHQGFGELSESVESCSIPGSQVLLIAHLTGRLSRPPPSFRCFLLSEAFPHKADRGSIALRRLMVFWCLPISITWWRTSAEYHLEVLFHFYLPLSSPLVRLVQPPGLRSVNRWDVRVHFAEALMEEEPGKIYRDSHCV